MSRNPFRPAELAGAADPIESTAELLGTARLLESLASDGVRPSEDFSDRVLAAIAGEPLPRPMAVAGVAARQGRLGAMLGALRDTWHVAWSGGRPFAVRAQAMAFVLVLIVAVGSVGGWATVGAINILTATPQPTHDPNVTAPSETSEPNRTAEPTRLHEPSETPEPAKTAEPTETPEPTETAEPTETPEPSDDHHGTGPGRTPRPTSEPTETPEPTENEGSDGHGGGGGGGHP